MQRRAFLTVASQSLLGPAGSLSARSEPAPASDALTLSADPARAGASFDPASFASVGVLDIDWLLEPRFTRLLDAFAASPRAFRSVRFFGALSSGEKENVFPGSSGTVWNDTAREPDFARTLEAIDALVSRGLAPFVGLNFFPRAVSPSPIAPPADWAAWQFLLERFFAAIGDRFGDQALASWRFEVGNEPNMPHFWSGSFEQYIAMYRATSDTVRKLRTRVRIGGPVIAYVPGEGPALMHRFLSFLRDEPKIWCDFISYHRKGIWVAGENEPSRRRLVEAGEEVAEALLRMTPGRASGMTLINNEADMKVAFDTPYEPRMTEQFPAWMTAVMADCDALDAKYAAHGIRFLTAADNANQQLVRGPFDGRRSVTTQASVSPTDLLKLPIYHFYELLALLGNRHGSASEAARADAAPADVIHLGTVADDRVAILLSLYAEADRGQVTLRCVVRDLPWAEVNVVEFRINAALSNAYSVAGRRLDHMPGDRDAQRRVRSAQELATAAMRSRVPVTGGTVEHTIPLTRFATSLLWITPFSDRRPAPPAWVRADVDEGRVVLRWEPSREPGFYAYLVTRTPGGSVAPPLRGATWTDTAMGPGEYGYEVRVLTASGLQSEAIRSPQITV